MKLITTMDTEGSDPYSMKEIADWVQDVLFCEQSDECQYPELIIEATEEEYQAFGEYLLDVCRFPEELFSLVKRV